MQKSAIIDIKYSSTKLCSFVINSSLLGLLRQLNYLYSRRHESSFRCLKLLFYLSLAAHMHLTSLYMAFLVLMSRQAYFKKIMQETGSRSSLVYFCVTVNQYDEVISKKCSSVCPFVTLTKKPTPPSLLTVEK